MAEIVLATLNAKYIHASFGLRYLMANLGELKPRALLLEFDINQRPLEIAERILEENPAIIGLGIYIWNVRESTELVRLLKRLRPELLIVLGGPEVSFETAEQEITRLADFVVTGEADLKFAELCRDLLDGRPPTEKVIPAPVPALDQLALPYEFYTDEDVANRVIYVEASRGCPFTCEFCLSSLDIPVRQFPLDHLLSSLEGLLGRGVRQFKFVDRTFNLNLQVSRRILQFFLERYRPGLFVHFEMIPDRLPAELREWIAKFPAGALQFEVGIQTFNPVVAKNISRRQNYDRLAENFAFLRSETGVHVHADLIVGLPGETIESFGAGFDRLIAMRPQEIQVGILKRLRGTPIVRHDSEFGMVYSGDPPYEILRNGLIDFRDMQRLRRFARYWDLLGNSGNFVETLPLLWVGGKSPFAELLRWTDRFHEREERTHGIALTNLAERLFEYLTTVSGVEPIQAAQSFWRDWRRCGRVERPIFLKPYVSDEEASAVRSRGSASAPKRQARHLGAVEIPVSR
jgi:radical SAM superfamily enzyme YgiQ (UPF0313 family)